MADQVQCPNCGGYRVTTSKVETLWISVPFSSAERRKSITQWLIGIPVSIIIVLAIGFLSTALGLDNDNPVAIGVGWIGLPFLCVILIAPFAIPYLLFHKKTKNVVKGQLYHYYCSLCGYRWSWETGTPTPQVNVRPDLIAKGSQRLEEEEEERRQAAAATWYLQQRQKK